MTRDNAFYVAAERRIEYFTVGLGAAGTIAACIFWSLRNGLGVAAGAAFAWLNYRWLRQGVATMTKLAVGQAGAEKVRVPRGTYVKIVLRYILLIVAAYVILHFFKIQTISLLAGFAANVVAVFAEMIGQLVWKREEPQANS
jgi:small-conductance mechanosensitive channel